MSRVDPLLVEAWHGLSRSAEATRGQYGWLLMQAAVLVLAWPWRSMDVVLTGGHPPRTLFAVTLATGLWAVLHGVRAGAQLAPLPGQHALRDWLVATPLGAARLLSGWLAAQLLALLHQLLLSAPVLLAACAVSAASWHTLGLLVLGIALPALAYRLCGGVAHLLTLRRVEPTLPELYALVGVTQLAAALLLPGASLPLLAYALLVEGHTMGLAVAGVPGYQVFQAVHGTIVVLLTAVLYGLLRWYRQGAPATVATRRKGG